METKSILAAVMIIVVSAAVSVEGRTDVSGSISADTIWDVNGSPYVLTDDVYVNSGATLLIEQAVEVNSPGAVYTLSVSGQLIARDADVNGVNITATARGSLDLLGCSVIGGTVTVDEGATARVKYSSLSSLSLDLDSDANTYVTGNDFSEGAVTTDGNSSATINIEANWWGDDPNGSEPNGIDPNYFIYVHGKITDHCDNISRPYADFSPYLSQLPPQDSNSDGAIGDLLGQVFIFNDVTGEAEPYRGTVVTVDDSNQLFRLTDLEGKFAFSGIPVGETTISVAKSPLSVVPSLFYDMSEKVLVGENSETFVYMRVTPKLPPVGFATTSSSSHPPSVVEIRSKHFGPYRHTYYLDGVSLEQTVTATVDWGFADTNGREVRWYRGADNFATNSVSESNQVTYESLTFDIDDELDAGQYTQLKVRASDNFSGDSVKEPANLDVIVPPPGVPPILLKPDTSQSVIFYRIVGSDFWAFEALMKGVGAVGSVIPCLSGSPYELGAKAYASAQVRGDGTASVVFLDGYELPSIEVGDVEITPSVSLELGWEYISDNWDPWGELGLGVEGSYTTPPNYTIVLVGPVPVPVYWRLEMGMGFDQGFDMDVNGWNEPPVPNWNAQDEFMFKLWLELMLGVGIADIAAVEGYFGGGAEMYMDHDVKLQALYIKLYGGLRVVVWIFKYEKKAIYYKWKMPVGESSRSSMIRMAMNSGGSGELAVFTRSYQLDRDDYAIEILNDANLIQYLGDYNLNLFDLGEERPLQHNVFPYSQPAIAADGDDLLLVWVYDDPCRDTGDPNSLNRTRIMFSRRNGASGNWSEPNYVDSDDGSPDFSPQLAVMSQNQALCVWEDSDSNLADANLTDMAAAMGISAAYYNNNGTWEPSTQLSDDNSQLDRSPRLAAGTNKAMAVWISNSENNIGIDPTANTGPNNTVYCKIWENQTWESLQTVGTGIGVIGKTALAMSGDGSKAIYVYELDSDANLGTDTDRELYAFSYSDGNWSDDPCQLTYNGLADTNPQVVYNNDNSIFLAWNCDGYIVSVDGLNLSELQSNTLALVNVSRVGQLALPVDFHKDGWVDFLDFAVLASQWQNDCNIGNNWCGYCDLDQSGIVDDDDVRIFSDFWLTEQAPFIGSAGARDFCLAKASDGRISVVWPERAADGNGIDVFTATYLPSWSVWSFPYPLTCDESLERSLAATYVGSSVTQQLALAYNEVAFDFNEVNIPPDDDSCDPNWLVLMRIPEPNRVDLYTLTHQLRHDLRITAGDISFEPRNPLPGSTVEITAVIHNTGDFAEVNVPVFFYHENPFNPSTLLTIQETNIPGLILPGGQGIITIPWRVPEIVFGPQQIHISADPCNDIEDEDSGDGSDPNDNDANTSVMAPDLAVSMINAKEIDPNRGLTARIKNTGGVRVDGARVIVCYGYHGEPNYSEVIAKFDISLDPNAFYDIRYMWSPPAGANDTPLYVVADPNDAIDEFDEENNIGFGLIHLEE